MCVGFNQKANVGVTGLPGYMQSGERRGWERPSPIRGAREGDRKVCGRSGGAEKAGLQYEGVTPGFARRAHAITV